MKIYEEVIKCSSDTKIVDVAKLIKKHEVRHVYVVEENKLVGVVAGMDITNKIVAQGKDYNEMTAKDIMNSVEAVKENQAIEYAYAIMRNFNTFICPVVNEENELIGYYKFAEVCEEINNKIHR